jgi:uncharacterized membrane protein
VFPFPEEWQGRFLMSLRRLIEFGLIFYVVMILLRGFYTTYPDGVLRLAMTDSLLTQGTVITTHGPINYAPLQSFLMLPAYALGYLIGMVAGVSPAKMSMFGSAACYFLFLPVIVSILCALYYKILKEMGVDENTGIISTLVLLFGTFLLSYATGMFSEPLSALLILISFYYFWMAQSGDYTRNNRKNFLYVSLLILNNFVFLLYAGLMVAYVFWVSWVRRNNRSEAWKMALEGSVCIGVSVAVFLVYNYLRYGQFLNFGYEGEGFTGNWLMGMYGLLFSFGKGLLIFSPLTFLCIFYFVFNNPKMESLQKFCFATVLISFACYLLVYSKWGVWFGGLCWGPRFLLPFVPLIHLMFPWLWQSLTSANKILRGGMYLLMVWAVGMNFLHYLNPDAIFKQGNLAASQNYEQKLFIPEESIILKIWSTENMIPRLFLFLGILGLCVLLLRFWKKGFPAKLSAPRPTSSETS